MPKSDSTAGDLAQEILDLLAARYGRARVAWVDDVPELDDSIRVEDDNGFTHYVHVELG
jgi:hypothetical protein